jgi:hypothetical protein
VSSCFVHFLDESIKLCAWKTGSSAARTTCKTEKAPRGSTKTAINAACLLSCLVWINAGVYRGD